MYLYSHWSKLLPCRLALLFCLLSSLGFAADTPRVFAAPTSPTIQTGDSLAHAYLRVNDHLLIDQPGHHLGRPQLSPDGKTIAVEVIPTGTETEPFAQIYLFDSASGQLLTKLAGHSPEWAADSQTFTFHKQTQIIAYNVSNRQQTVTATNAPDETARRSLLAAGTPLVHNASLALAYPQTIRVMHSAANPCRKVPPGQIDVIPFEEYVARVVPAEVPTSWPLDALKAMAIAARTYAWRLMLEKQPDYDVSDWVSNQAMCDMRSPSTDEAVAKTAGQYLSEIGFAGAPILSMYCAETGHPTVNSQYVTFLKGVPDLFALGKWPDGHGMGLSQWGAQRRAAAGHTYRQILGHYYTNVNLQNANNPSEPLGGLSAPLPGDALTTNALYWNTLIPSGATDAQIKLSGANLANPVVLSGADGIWRAPMTLSEGGTLTAELWVGGIRQEQVALPIDTTPPPTPKLSTTPNGTGTSVTVNADAGAVAGLSQGWLWEGETLTHTVNSGALVADTQATNGTTWLARAGVQQTGIWSGPRTTVLPAGHAYRAIFRLRANVTAAVAAAGQAIKPLARLDVADNAGAKILGVRNIWPGDFANSTDYRPIAVDFYLFNPANGLEFRVNWPGGADLALDYVQIWRIPDPGQAGQTLTWSIANNGDLQSLSAVAFDAAGNMSPPTSQTGGQGPDNQAPVFGNLQGPTGWISTTNATLSATVTDPLSGLDSKRAALVVDQQAVSATLSAPNNPTAAQTITAQAQRLAEGQHTAYFRAADRAGNEAQSSSFSLRVDTTRPTIAATLNITTTKPWFTTPVLVTLAGQDERSGIKQLAYTLDQTNGVYNQPVSLAKPGRHQFSYWAIDNAGNISPMQSLTVTLDLTPPTVNLSVTPLGKDQVQLQWQINDDASGVARIELQTQVNGVWQNASTTPTQSVGNLTFTVAADAMLPVRMRAVDNAGRTSDWVEKQLSQTVNTAIYLPLTSR